MLEKMQVSTSKVGSSPALDVGAVGTSRGSILGGVLEGGAPQPRQQAISLLSSTEHLGRKTPACGQEGPPRDAINSIYEERA